jgi:phage terminase large subunit-like protein
LARKSKQDDKLTGTRGEKACAWIERYCVVPEGPDIGKPVKLRPWQREIILLIYDNPQGTRRAIISFGRKNGKTAICACIVLLHLCGVEAIPNSHIYSAAQSRDQAAIIFGLAAKIVRLSPVLSNHVTIRDTKKELLCPQIGTDYSALSAEASTAMGLSPVLTIFDELGQCRGPRSELYDALETATGGQAHPLTIIISTQAPTDGDLLSILIDDAKREDDPHTVVKLYTAGLELDPFSEPAIKAANPAFGDFQNDKEVLNMAMTAKRMPSAEAGYRNLVLNQRVEASTPFVAHSVWRACGDAPRPLEKGMKIYGGLDLSAVADLTALVLIGKHNGKWHCHPTFWLPADGLRERARTDRVPYDIWHKQGNLEAVAGRSIDYEYVARWLRQLFEQFDIRKVGFDPWKFEALKQWLIKVGFTEKNIEDHFVEVGQGYKSMTPALRTLEGEILNERIAHGNHPVLTMCADNAVVVTDPAGNRKLDKSKSIRRIDGMVALAMAFGVADVDAEEVKPTYRVMVI